MQLLLEQTDFDFTVTQDVGRFLADTTLCPMATSRYACRTKVERSIQLLLEQTDFDYTVTRDTGRFLSDTTHTHCRMVTSKSVYVRQCQVVDWGLMTLTVAVTGLEAIHQLTSRGRYDLYCSCPYDAQNVNDAWLGHLLQCHRSGDDPLADVKLHL